MKYLKTFESYTQKEDYSQIESLSYFSKVLELTEDPEFKEDFQELIDILSDADTKLIESLFNDPELSAEMLFQEGISTYKMESIQKIDTQSLARQALKHLVAIGAISVLVKLFYKVADYVFSNLDEMGIPAVAGGVLVILLYLAFGKTVGSIFTRKSNKNVQIEDEFTDSEEI